MSYSRKLSKAERELIGQKVAELGTSKSQIVKELALELAESRKAVSNKFYGHSNLFDIEANVLYRILGEDPILNFLADYKPLVEPIEVKEPRKVREKEQIEEKKSYQRKLSKKEIEKISQKVNELGTSKSQIVKRFYQQTGMKKSSAGYKFFGLCPITEEEAGVLYKVLGEDHNLDFLINYRATEVKNPELVGEKKPKKENEIFPEEKEISEKPRLLKTSLSAIEKAREKLIDIYLEHIKSDYLQGDSERRIELTHGLEKLLEDLEK